MRVEFTVENSDHSGPVLDIHATNAEDAYELGRIYEKICNVGGTVWSANSQTSVMLRVPLLIMDEIGLAVTYKEGKK